MFVNSFVVNCDRVASVGRPKEAESLRRSLCSDVSGSITHAGSEIDHCVFGAFLFHHQQFSRAGVSMPGFKIFDFGLREDELR